MIKTGFGGKTLVAEYEMSFKSVARQEGSGPERGHRLWTLEARKYQSFVGTNCHWVQMLGPVTHTYQFYRMFVTTSGTQPRDGEVTCSQPRPPGEQQVGPKKAVWCDTASAQNHLRENVPAVPQSR